MDKNEKRFRIEAYDIILRKRTVLRRYIRFNLTCSSRERERREARENV